MCCQWRTVLIEYLRTAGTEVPILLRAWLCPRILGNIKISVRCAKHYVFCSVRCLSQKDLRLVHKELFSPLDKRCEPRFNERHISHESALATAFRHFVAKIFFDVCH